MQKCKITQKLVKLKKNFNETTKLQNFLNQIQRRIQDPDNIQDGNLSDISPRLKALVMSQKAQSQML